MTGPVETVRAPHYNQAYEKLVDNAPNELVGLIAYGLYKKSKREYVQEFHRRNSRQPNESELKEYAFGLTETNIKSYLDNANSSLVGFAQVVVDEAKPDIYKEAIKGKWYQDIFFSIAGAFSYTVILLVIVKIVKYAGVDLISILLKS